MVRTDSVGWKGAPKLYTSAHPFNHLRIRIFSSLCLSYEGIYCLLIRRKPYHR